MPYKIIIIVLAVLGGVYSVVLNAVKYRSAENPTPANLSDVYDAETYSKWKKYSAEHSRLNLISSIVTSIITIALLCTNAYSAVALLFPSFMWQLFSILLLETVISAVVGTIFKYIQTMVIEQKYGFNRSTMKTFIFDRVKGIILELGLSVFLIWIIYIFHTLMGDWMIIPIVVVLFAFGLLISFLYPVLSRVGNKFTPLEDGELKDRLMELLSKHGYKVKAIEVMDASRRTTKLNAYFTGFGKLKTIVLYDNLVNSMSVDEICAVFAHELGHGLHKDVLKHQILSIGEFIIIAITAWLTLCVPELYTQFGFETINYGFAYIAMGSILEILQPFISLFINYMSRSHEYRADKQSVKEGYGAAMIMALKKLSKENFAHLSPSRLNVILEYSHPPLGERISAIEKEMKNK